MQMLPRVCDQTYNSQEGEERDATQAAGENGRADGVNHRNTGETLNRLPSRRNDEVAVGQDGEEVGVDSEDDGRAAEDEGVEEGLE